MTTPIYDFLTRYAEKNGVRLHMPGHKGIGVLGCEHLDITEIDGADVLYAPDGIIAESEANASALFGTAHTYYSTEGSTLAIKAMLTLALRQRRRHGRATVVAGRNAHRAFLHGAALLDLDVAWVYPRASSHLCGGVLLPEDIARTVEACDVPPFAVYVTSPSYLGEVCDIAAIAAVCRRYDIPLLVDNAHGAHLAFLPPPARHPMQLGAAMCADSAHKSLSVLTGGAYLHVARGFEHFLPEAREALSLFASSSPSYLTLASLDLANARLAGAFRQEALACAERVTRTKTLLSAAGFTVSESEPFKIVIQSLNARRLADALRHADIEPEMADGSHLVLMLSPETSEEALSRLCDLLLPLGKQEKAPREACFSFAHAEVVLSPREALFAPHERIGVQEAVGRICAQSAVSCPPAVPIAVCGERITSETAALFLQNGIATVSVVKK